MVVLFGIGSYGVSIQEMVVVPSMVLEPKFGRLVLLTRHPSISDCLSERPKDVLLVTAVSMCKKNVGIQTCTYFRILN